MVGMLEHANITVSDAPRTAAMLCDLFDWRIRWQGEAINGGHSVHVGSESSYLAVYTPKEPTKKATSGYETIGRLNHVGVVVNDLEEVKRKVLAAGYKPYNFGDYEPGKRFYFVDSDDVEFEVVEYD